MRSSTLNTLCQHTRVSLLDKMFLEHMHNCPHFAFDCPLEDDDSAFVVSFFAHSSCHVHLSAHTPRKYNVSFQIMASAHMLFGPYSHPFAFYGNVLPAASYFLVLLLCACCIVISLLFVCVNMESSSLALGKSCLCSSFLFGQKLVQVSTMNVYICICMTCNCMPK